MMEPIRCSDEQIEKMKQWFWICYVLVFFFFIFVYWPVAVVLFFIGWMIASLFVKGV